MATSHLVEPVVARSGASAHSHEEDKYTPQPHDNPLEVHSKKGVNPFDEPPPPYEQLAHAPQIAPIEYSSENSPQLQIATQPDFFSTSQILSPDSSLPEVSRVQPHGSPAIPSLVPAPLQFRSRSSHTARKPVNSPPGSSFSSTKAREAGFELETPTLSRSSSSQPSITILSSTEPLRHTREPGKLTAYLIPFPKPRLRGVRFEDIPDRFLVYTPPPPPLSKPAPGEKESQWHKTRRTWQEDVRKATMQQASRVSWKGMKAQSTILIGKGVNKTRSSNVEFLDRVAEGTIASTDEDLETPAPESATQELEDTPIATPELSAGDPIMPDTVPVFTQRASSAVSSTKSADKEAKPQKLEELTLIFPPSLDMAPDKIRTEFVDSLLRTREKSRKEAVVASSLLPFAAAVDASLILTFGGLTEVSGVWAYTSIRGAITSKKMTQGLAFAEEKALKEEQGEEDDTEMRGCTCGNHEHEHGIAHSISKLIDKGKAKKEKAGINLIMQQSTRLEILRRYLDLACLKKEFSMFPQFEEAAGDVTEATVLEAIGWQPTRRGGRDLEMEFKDKVETLTAEQDEQWQRREAKEDVRRIMKKGASEWVQWCKGFQKDPEAAMKK